MATAPSAYYTPMDQEYAAVRHIRRADVRRPDGSRDLAQDRDQQRRSRARGLRRQDDERFARQVAGGEADAGAAVAGLRRRGVRSRRSAFCTVCWGTRRPSGAGKSAFVWRLAAACTGIFALVLREGALLIGIRPGGGGSSRIRREEGTLKASCSRIRPTDPVVFGVSLALMTLVGLAACAFPARRATRIDPAVVLADG